MMIIAVASFTVAFSGLNVERISSVISSALFPKADYTVESLDVPTALPQDFVQSLSTSPRYYEVTSVRLGSDAPYLGDPLRLSISFENRGKNSVQKPRVVVYFVDPIYRVWAVWNESVTNETLRKGCSVEYRFPPLDQKIVGSWGAYVLLYDDADNALVSYVIRYFATVEVPQTPWWVGLLFMVGASVAMFVLVTLVEEARKRWFKKKQTVEKG